MEMCAKGLHPRIKPNVYRSPTTGYLQCRPCKDDARDATRAKQPKPTKAARLPLDPAIVARLRAADAADRARA